MKKSYETKLALLNLVYRRHYDQWVGKFSDDRMVYCNIFEMLDEAMFEMKEINNDLIWCGFNKIFNEKIEMLDGIIKNFE